MKDSPLMIKSKEFALEVIKVCKALRSAKCESALINQFLRSGTSVGANIREAFYAHGTADFVAKLQIGLKNAPRVSIGSNCFLKVDITTTRLCLFNAPK